MSVTALDVTRGASSSGRPRHTWLTASAGLFAFAAVLLPFVGPAPLELDRVLARQEPDWSILVQLRLSRTLLGLFAGGALGLSGSLFQAMLRDALATPYTLGVSTGASLGAVVAIAAGWHTVLGVPGLWIGALAGAAVVLTLVVGAATRRAHASSFGLLLTGIAMNSVASAFIVLIHGLSGLSHSFSISRWLLGSVDAVGYPALIPFAAAVSAVAFAIVGHARHWNLLAVGEDWAAARGARVGRLMVGGLIGGSVLAAGTVALTGPIGFVGLIVPHLARKLVGADHRVLMPCSFFLGGALLAGCDAIGRAAVAPAELPAGAILALLGGPYLVWLVRNRA
jgi:iron complex transport system permease protein